MQTLTCLSRTVVHHRRSTQQLDIITALVHILLYSLWFVFLTSIQQRRVLECTFVVLNNTSTHCHAYRKCTGSLKIRCLYNYSGHAAVVPMVSALDGFHCVTIMLLINAYSYICIVKAIHQISLP